MFTFGEAKKSTLKNIAGVCPDSDEFRDLLNEGTEDLLRLGHWLNTVKKIRACTYNSCVTWPREVGTVLAMNVGGCHTPIFNNWIEWMPMEGSDYSACCRNRGEIISDGTSPVFNQISCNQGMYIRHYPELQADLGKRWVVFGVDINGQTIRSQRSDGTWQDGLENIVTIPFSSTNRRLRRVTRVYFPDEMVGPSRLYQYDPDRDVLLDMALYQAGENSPNYRTTHINGHVGQLGCNGATQVTAYIKLEFIPVKYDSDLVQIGCKKALKLAMQTIKVSDSYSHEEAEKAFLRAVRALNNELNDKYPLNQIPVQIRTFGTANLSHHGVGMI